MRLLIVCGLSWLAVACAVPSLHGIAEGIETIYDESLLGKWYGPEDWAFTVESGKGNTYAITWVRREEGEEPVPVALTAALVQLGEHRVLDVRLSKDELKAIGERYGTLLVPAHHFYVLSGGDDQLEVLTLDPEWLEESGVGATVDDMPVLVSGPKQIRGLLREALGDEAAWNDFLELSRRPESSGGGR